VIILDIEVKKKEMNTNKKVNEKEGNKSYNILVSLLVITSLVLMFNTLSLSNLTNGSSGLTGSIISNVDSNSVIPTGIPEIYGEELGLRYDDVSANDPYIADVTIGVLAQIDRSVELSGTNKERYINTLYNLEGGMSCEYCCGARSIIFETGEAACGCAHSYAMRGLTKYLLTEHGDEYSDVEILEEVGKWKTLFFPTQMQQKADVLAEKGIEFSYVNLASNANRGIEQGTSSSGGMVGGC
jgi:hypothetical protein